MHRSTKVAFHFAQIWTNICLNHRDHASHASIALGQHGGLHSSKKIIPAELSDFDVV